MVKKRPHFYMKIPDMDTNSDQVIIDLIIDEISVTEDKERIKELNTALKDYGTFMSKVDRLRKVI